MQLSPSADMADSLIIVYESVGAGLAVFLLTVLLEGAAMRYLEWDTLRTCLIDSFMMNAVSLVAGFVMICSFLFIPFVQFAAEFMLVSLPGVLLSLLIGWFLSSLIEGQTLSVMRKKPLHEIFRMVLIVNALSYVGLVILYFIFIWVPEPIFYYDYIY